METIMDTLKTLMKDERVLVGITAAVAGLSLKLATKKKPKLPPGPPVWPVVGSLPYIRNDLAVFSELAEKYGDIYFLQFGLCGQVPTVVLNNMDLIREALLQKGDDFAGRHMSPVFGILSNQGHDIGFGQFNAEWRYQRKIAHMALRKYATGNNFQELLERNVEMISEMFRNHANEPQDIVKANSLLIYNIVASFCFGKRYDMKDPEFLHILRIFTDTEQLFTGYYLADLWPPLRYIPTPGINAARRIGEELYDFFSGNMAEHKKNFDPNGLRDLTDYIIHSEQEMKNTGLEEYQVKLNDEHFIFILFDMFAAGTDTSRMTLTWALMFLAANPEIQKRAQKEIDDKMGKEGKINSQNRAQIPFCEAIIYETLRMRMPVPIAVPHQTTCDTSVGGYEIPKGTQVLINLKRVHDDPREWDNPEIFNPQRFIDEQGNLAPKPNAFLPFSAGRRSCVGESLAKYELHIILGSLLQRFSFYPRNGEEIDLIPMKNVVTQLPKQPLLLVNER